MKRIIVVGAGPAGMMAAIRAGQLNQDVVLIEKNPVVGRKLLLSGKGRCNLTNAGDLDSFLPRFSGNSQFLRDAFKKFFNADLIRFFEDAGLELAVERQERVFPSRGLSGAVVKVLTGKLKEHTVRTLLNTAVTGLVIESGRAAGVRAGSAVVPAEAVIMATGGVSYAFTGSTGEGLEMARRAGHRIEKLLPGLVPLVVKKEFELPEGLTLKNVKVAFSAGSLEIESGIGEMVFTGTGVSGPLVLSLSSHISPWLENRGTVAMRIDLKPGLSEQKLEERLLREFRQNSRMSFGNILKGLVPVRMVKIFLSRTGIDGRTQAAQVTKHQRNVVITMLKKFPLTVTGTSGIEEAMVTRGGVSLKDIDPRTMQSRKIRGLYFCGEMIDVDADTGGFNLQAAFSTGYLAGDSASSAEAEHPATRRHPPESN